MRLERPPALNDDPVFIEALAGLVRGAGSAGSRGARVKLVVVGGGIAGLAAVHRLVTLAAGRPMSRWSNGSRAAGGVVTERAEGFVIEGAADSFLS